MIGYFGRAGDGPGEFIGPTSIDRAPDGGIVVTDMERGRLLWFRPTGELLSESKAPAAFFPTGRIAGSLLGKTVVSNEHVQVDLASGDITHSRVTVADNGAARRPPRAGVSCRCSSDWRGVGH